MSARGRYLTLLFGSVSIAATLLAGCAHKPESDPQYVSYGPSLVPPLEVPPDLVKPADAGSTSGSASLSSLDTPAGNTGGVTVLPQFEGLSIERAGDARWLKTRQPPEKVWPAVREFVLSQGMPIAAENADLGLLETEWLNNRSERDVDLLQKYLGKVVPGLFSSGLRDRYRFRLDRSADGDTEVHIAHRGLEEVIAAEGSGIQVTQTRWQRRPSDPELEAEMLRRLMLQLGAPPQAAQAARERSAAERAIAIDDGGRPALQLKANLDEAWQRVGSALDRLGYVVRTRDRTQAVYGIRYTDPTAAGDDNAFWQRALGDNGNNAPAQTADYEIALQAQGEATLLRLRDKHGKPVAADAAAPILEQLRQQLR